MVSDREITVEQAAESDLQRTAFLHVTELPHGLFPKLGQGLVFRWHRAHVRSGYGIVLVAHDGHNVAGFIVGTTDQRANVSWIIRHHRRELISAGPLALAVRPWLALSFLRIRGLRYARRILRPDLDASSAPDRSLPNRSTTGPVAVLEAVVVDWPERGKGIGTMLVEAFLKQVAAAGVDRVELVTKADARGAAGFYEHNGWRRVGGHTDRDGDEVFTYKINPRLVHAR